MVTHTSKILQQMLKDCESVYAHLGALRIKGLKCDKLYPVFVCSDLLFNSI